MDINKEFLNWLLSIGEHVDRSTDDCGTVTYASEQNAIRQEAYIAAATPRDLLIEQLVKALKAINASIIVHEDGCIQTHSETGEALAAGDAALSAAKERGYGEG